MSNREEGHSQASQQDGCGLRNARYLSDLTEAQAQALERCSTTTVPATTSSKGGFTATTGIAQATIRSLYVHGLIEVRRGRRWKPTVRGWEVLHAEEPRLLAQSSVRAYVRPGSTLYETNGAMFAEPEAVDAATQERISQKARDTFGAMRSGRDERLFQEQRSLTERLHVLHRLANQRGIDVRSELRIVERGLDAVERKIRSQRAA